MEKEKSEKKKVVTSIFLWVIRCLILCLICLLCKNIFFKKDSGKEYFRSTSTLIDVEEIASLSVSEFVYNGIAQKEKSNGDIEYNVLYNSTVKLSVDAGNIRFDIDEDNKLITFTFSEFTYDDPMVDVDSLSFIPSEKSVEIKDVISLCREDALNGAKKSDKLILLAKENLKSIIEAWYSPIFDGYAFEYVFDAAEGGETE